MKNILIIIFSSIALGLNAQTADEIIDRVDKNMSAENRIVESSMTIHGKRNSRTMTSISKEDLHYILTRLQKFLILIQKLVR